MKILQLLVFAMVCLNINFLHASDQQSIDNSLDVDRQLFYDVLSRLIEERKVDAVDATVIFSLSKDRTGRLKAWKEEFKKKQANVNYSLTIFTDADHPKRVKIECRFYELCPKSIIPFSKMK